MGGSPLVEEGCEGVELYIGRGCRLLVVTGGELENIGEWTKGERRGKGCGASW